MFAPTGTKDYSHLHHQDPPVRRRRRLPRACRATTTTRSCRRRSSTACPRRCKLLTEIVDLASIRAVGDASLGLIGSVALQLHLSTHPANKEFVALWKKEHGTVPDTFEGEQWQCMKVFEAGIEQGRRHRGRQAAPGARGHRRSRASRARCICASATTRACSRASWSKVVKKRGLRHAGAGGDRHLPGRTHHAALQQA